MRGIFETTHVVTFTGKTRPGFSSGAFHPVASLRTRSYVNLIGITQGQQRDGRRKRSPENLTDYSKEAILLG